ncbi:hypothetical protein MSG28_001922 [Choristoneura fumiferana]|uniref:Uncharacterized protein n=1 Tax=Choristoneura fumiferana TaxID=7141 RepID=A0ACC0JT71_CHOFU|nr:hypothetical protein MSG28_001922 [Choristoneura fumiferana]
MHICYKGIISELEHFPDAGIDAIWMSPIFESPMIDFGYDISNFYKIHHEYGTIEDFRELLEKAHSLGLKVLLDFVPNHASTFSEYFEESEAGNPEYADYFVWADGYPDPDNDTNRLPPSNWFAVEQADFNFRHQPAHPDDHEGRYPDDPLSGMSQFESHQLGYTIPLYTKDLIELYDVVYEWRDFTDEYQKEHGGDTRVLFSEGYANISMTMLYYGNEAGATGAHFPFNFDFITDVSAESNARDFVYVILKWLTYMPFGAVPNWVFGNHDNNRMPTRFRETMVDGINALNMLLPGVAVTYQGEEIGMKDAGKILSTSKRATEGMKTRTTCIPEIQQELHTIGIIALVQDFLQVYQALSSLRKHTTLSHGEYDIRAFTDNSFYLVRSLRTYDTLVLVFNVAAEASDTIDLSRVPHLQLPATNYNCQQHSDSGTRRSFSVTRAAYINDMLDHIVDAGVGAIWMSPIFVSPMVDFGYDISDFYNIQPEYGTMEDFEELVEKAHELGIKVLLDYVPNHASTESHYFQRSEASDPEFYNYFVWADPKIDPENETNRLVPSNWISQFGGTVWEWSEVRQQYYLHQFAIEQADFNFREPAVREEMINIMRYWIEKGADGFRVDAIPHLFEANPEDYGGEYPDEPWTGNAFLTPDQPGYTTQEYVRDLIELYDVVYEWRAFADQWKEENGAETNLSAQSNARDFVYVVKRWLTYMPQGEVANWVFGNHDNNRMPTGSERIW